VISAQTPDTPVRLGPIARLRSLALRSLEGTYVPGELRFVFRIVRDRFGSIRTEGLSDRYTATAMIGLAGEAPSDVRGVLAGTAPTDVCDSLAEASLRSDDLGQVALTLWACRAWSCAGAETALRRLEAMAPADGPFGTVEVAWSLAALCARGDPPAPPDLRRALARRLVESSRTGSGLFPHWPGGSGRFRLRGHVACFADQVYPIQALAMHHRLEADRPSLAAAGRCAEQICALQGPEGQWWWHYDVRTGAVVERYPVYSVHQDAMAPMALHVLGDVSGRQFGPEVVRGLGWLAHCPETGGSMVDDEHGVIWRKVGRNEPAKLSRRANAACSRLLPGARAPFVGAIFPPTRIDYESRPYHMGWILHAWADGDGFCPRAYRP
jgi:hypothetical protein